MPDGIVEYSGGVMISTNAKWWIWLCKHWKSFLQDDTFNELALAMIEAISRTQQDVLEMTIQTA